MRALRNFYIEVQDLRIPPGRKTSAKKRYPRMHPTGRATYQVLLQPPLEGDTQTEASINAVAAPVVLLFPDQTSVRVNQKKGVALLGVPLVTMPLTLVLSVPGGLKTA